MRVLTVVGARPQFVKAFPVSRALGGDHEEVLVHTGQHYDDLLSDVFFRELAIPEPDHHLGVGSDGHAAQTAAMMIELDPLVASHSPDVVIVYGDTNSTLAGALVAAKRDVDLAHVEAGLRSFDREMPEEVNRVATDAVSDVLFAPSERAREHLAAENVAGDVHVAGDVTYDALKTVHARALEASTAVSDLGLADGGYVLATVHRAANTDDPDRLRSVLSGLADAPQRVVLPAHPRTTAALERAGIDADALEGVRLVDPVGYLDFVRLIDGAERVATDSGGVQKEAFYLDTPCVTLRDHTEWVETVDAGWNVLVGADRAAIAEALAEPFDGTDRPEPYGDGDAARRIVEALAGRG
ncbi:UDP-N-acetylglucosamine 2-epimerase (non-hydrolyzing) (plasmid) [Halobaculum sp. CBA1158]|uniref:non-hydrolyzing UDP-N-acetylglucosamine 2-epimerase n=1 Tax=Halobaculum sp. CBA1158 TaxID=2904243 RepID=UPI001F26B68B|nr:UDP-N-acetylglucosamine 2-epimerase (non-hydrolyzing) [Halobaculum sp. CBA1158]UIP01469.1 UDP-N-acetylglucosamine 2-epimerase (non-hydrolyzing) [Halobaculum sp. CBA1158]